MTSTLTSLLQTLRIVPMTHSKLQPLSNDGLNVEKSKTKLPEQQLKEITLEQVAHHDSYADCWIVIYDRVYEVTRFLREHPGGDDVIMDYAGRDATIAFHGTGHSRDAIEQMRNFLIGELPAEQRIFRTSHNKVLSTGIPE